MRPPAKIYSLHDGLWLVAPGGLYIPDQNALVVADLHVGYTPTLRARGFAVPAARDDDLIARVCTMLAATRASHLVVAGDLVHGSAAVRTTTDRDLSPLEEFLRAISTQTVTVVLGNHDRRIEGALTRLGLACVTSLHLGPHVVHHGDDTELVHSARIDVRARNGRVLIGHLHPALTLDDGMGAHAVVPAFVTAPGLVCLPALAPFARGGDIRSTALRTQLKELVGTDPMGAAVAVAGQVIPVGNVFERKRSDLTVMPPVQPAWVSR